MANMFSNKTANGDSTEVALLPGEHEFVIEGTFNGCTVTLETKDDRTGAVYVADDDKGIRTSPGRFIFTTSNQKTAKGVLTSAGGSTDIVMNHNGKVV